MKHLGKGFAWWFFKWPMFRRRIKMYWEKNLPNLAASYLAKILPEAHPGSREMVKWLAKKHHWKRSVKC